MNDILNNFIDINSISTSNKLYIIYSTLNKNTNKFYIGSHCGYVNDGYIGCGCYIHKKIPKKLGTYFVRSLRKHGIEVFEKRIIKICSSEEELRKKETIYLEFLFTNYSKEEFYNESCASTGGFLLKYDKEKDKKRIEKTTATRNRIKLDFPEEYKKSWDDRKRGLRIRNSGKGNPMYGRRHTEETRKRMSESRKFHRWTQEQRSKKSEYYTGIGNPYYGKKHSINVRNKMKEAGKDRIWINNGKINRRIKNITSEI